MNRSELQNGGSKVTSKIASQNIEVEIFKFQKYPKRVASLIARCLFKKSSFLLISASFLIVLHVYRLGNFCNHCALVVLSTRGFH